MAIDKKTDLNLTSLGRTENYLKTLIYINQNNYFPVADLQINLQMIIFYKLFK